MVIIQQQTTKRQMTEAQAKALTGKRIDPNKWKLPEGFKTCAMTGKLHPECALECSFSHWAFERSFLIEHGICIEDADWLSEEGYDLIMAKLESLGLLSQYREVAVFGGVVNVSSPVTPPLNRPAIISNFGNEIVIRRGDKVRSYDNFGRLSTPGERRLYAYLRERSDLFNCEPFSFVSDGDLITAMYSKVWRSK